MTDTESNVSVGGWVAEAAASVVVIATVSTIVAAATMVPTIAATISAIASTIAPSRARRLGRWAASHKRCYLGQHGLVGFTKQWHQVIYNIAILLIEEGDRNALFASTSCTANAVYVVVDVAGQIVLNHNGNIRNVETTRSNIGGHQHTADSVLEVRQRLLSLTLNAVSVNRGAGDAHLTKRALQVVCIAFLFNKHKDEIAVVLTQNRQQLVALCVILNEANVLGDVLCCRTDTTDLQKRVLAQEFASKLLNFTGERGAVHERLTLTCARHVGLRPLHKLADRWFESHVQHAVGLVKNHEADI
mmetsp:Transcript_58281/g.67241  ORF Transcript_58281/g.67241 Transcript_58281/m.67241 type:complete len:303 (+) Transcript_58281:1711-2619(+)